MTSSVSSFLDDIYKQSKQLEDAPEPPKIYSKKVLSNRTNSKILAYQKKHIINMISMILENGIALDSSDTGTGKTYIAIAICIELGKRPIIVCPKTLIYNWLSVCEYFDLKPYEIVNYETIRTGKSYTDSRFVNRMDSPFVKLEGYDPDRIKKNIYEWTVPDDAMVIFDEAHRCKSVNSDNGKLLISVKQLMDVKIPILLVSATIYEKTLDMKIPSYLFGKISDTRKYNYYVKNLTHRYPNLSVRKRDYAEKTSYETAKSNANSMMIREEIKRFTGRIRIKELGDKFPQNQVYGQSFIADSPEKISQLFHEIKQHMEELRSKQKTSRNSLARIQKLRQEIEMRKSPIFIEQANLLLDDGKSVIIFVNYIKTLEFLQAKLNIKCVIRGGQGPERMTHIEKFQSNEERIIICQVKSGGTGVNLNDFSALGSYPRAVLINYPDSASDLIQALGRAYRSGTTSPVLQKIIFVANVDYEKKIMENINKKLSNISGINDGDLNVFKYQIKKVEKS
uniref:Helicase ATP-binding domain-containing protein n=1 Tax=viral metagenome TaxID=1070528 RepID=A0A6C0CAU3_9ZZZZ